MHGLAARLLLHHEVYRCATTQTQRFKLTSRTALSMRGLPGLLSTSAAAPSTRRACRTSSPLQTSKAAAAAAAQMYPSGTEPLYTCSTWSDRPTNCHSATRAVPAAHCRRQQQQQQQQHVKHHRTQLHKAAQPASTLNPTANTNLSHGVLHSCYVIHYVVCHVTCYETAPHLYHDRKKWPYSLCQLPPWLTKKPVSQLRMS
jgi:hypothetical protein